MSFKYRFILSFVILEAVFIGLIVLINFVTISKSTQNLLNDRMYSNVIFLEEFLKVPMANHDLETLDNIVEKTLKQKFINTIVILDKNEEVLSTTFLFEHMSFKELLSLKKDKTLKYTNENYEIKYIPIIEQNEKLGSMYLIFDITENIKLIEKNKNNTLFLIIFEILLSAIIAYIIGYNLTKMLSRLTKVAHEIGENKRPLIPYIDKHDEIGILSKALNQMQEDLISRSDKLNEQNIKLEELSIAKDEFLANMSHELKTPLNSINVISSVMSRNKQGNLTPKDVQNISIINNSGNELLQLINDVLDISKLEAGEIETNLEDIDANKLINELFNNFEPLVQEKNIEFELICDKNLGFIHSDKLRIKQIMKNLLSNALKFTIKGKITVNAKFQNSDLVVSIEDTGIGISKEKLEHIFDRFKQADSSTTRKYGGTGLGLSICKELASLLEGKIEIESKIDIGSLFTVKLPINEDKINQNFIQNNKTSKHEKENIIVLNTDTISFLYITIELKKEFNYLQVKELEELTNLYSKGKRVLIDCDKISTDDIQKIQNLVSKNDLIVLYEEDSKIELFSKDYLILRKPFKVTHIM